MASARFGRQIVPTAHIIGSEGRYYDFDRRFLPRTDIVQGRWSSIERAMERGISLPPVVLYKISDVYFVRDGNHRVSVAHQVGLVEIDAEVTELLVDVPLTPDLSVRTLLHMQEYSDFLEWTNLHALRPDERIEFSELGGYLDLVRHINGHRAALAQAQHRTIDRDEAVASWYDTVYLPGMQAIREQNMLKRFSNRTEADLYRWMVEQQQMLSAGAPVSPGSHRRIARIPSVDGSKTVGGRTRANGVAGDTAAAAMAIARLVTCAIMRLRSSVDRAEVADGRPADRHRHLPLHRYRGQHPPVGAASPGDGRRARAPRRDHAPGDCAHEAGVVYKVDRRCLPGRVYHRAGGLRRRACGPTRPGQRSMGRGRRGAGAHGLAHLRGRARRMATTAPARSTASGACWARFTAGRSCSRAAPPIWRARRCRPM